MAAIVNLRDQLNNQLNNQLYSQLGNQLYSQLNNQLDNQLRNQLYSQLNNQLRNQLDNQLRNQLYNQLRRQLNNQLDRQLDNQLRNQLNNQLRRQLNRQLDNQLNNQLRRQLNNQLRNQLGNQLYSQLGNQLYSQLNNQLRRQLNNQLRNQLGNQLRRQLYQVSSHWCLNLWWRLWDCYYQWADSIGVSFDKEKLDLFHNFLTHVYFCIPYQHICFISEPSVKAYYKDNKLHRDGGASVEFKSSLDKPTFGVYTLNGVRVPQYLAETPASALDIEFFKKEQNADVKAEFIRKYGIERMVSLGTLIDTWENHPNTRNFEWYKKSEYKLIDMSSIFTTYDYLPYLYMKNQTVQGIYHLECCYNPDTIQQPRTILDGLRVRLNGINPEELEITSIA